MRDAVDAPEETRCGALKYAVEKWRSMHSEKFYPASLRMSALYAYPQGSLSVLPQTHCQCCNGDVTVGNLWEDLHRLEKRIATVHRRSLQHGWTLILRGGKTRWQVTASSGSQN